MTDEATPKVELSQNIKKFDEKIAKPRHDPFSYNAVSLKQDAPMPLSSTAAITDPTINRAAKALGVNTVRDWDKYYSKVSELVDWAKTQTKGDVVSWLYDQMTKSPLVSEKRINDLYIAMRVGAKPKREQQNQSPRLKKELLQKDEKISQLKKQVKELKIDNSSLSNTKDFFSSWNNQIARNEI